MKKLAYAVILLCWATTIVHVWQDTSGQWDFRAYFSAARARAQGVDPYDVKSVRAATGSPHTLPYYYPVAALYLIKPLAGMDYTAAYRMWLALKILALAALLAIWKRAFLRQTDFLLILAVALLGFNAATIWDLRAGNIETFEQLLLWGGFAFLVRSRVATFVACVAVAGAFKLLPAAFLFVLLLPTLRSRSRMVALAAGIAALILVTLVPLLTHPGYLTGFRHALSVAHPRLENNPSIFGLLDEIALSHPGLTAAPRYLLAALYYAAVLWFSRGLIRRWLATRSLPAVIMIATLLYAVLAPRLILYSYMIALVPVLGLVIPAVRALKVEAYAVVAAVCVSGLVVLPSPAGDLLGGTAPMLLVLGGWFIVVAAERAGALGALLDADGTHDAPPRKRARR